MKDQRRQKNTRKKKRKEKKRKEKRILGNYVKAPKQSRLGEG